MFCLYIFPPMIWILTEGEGDGMESRLFFINPLFNIFFSFAGLRQTEFMDFATFQPPCASGKSEPYVKR